MGDQVRKAAFWVWNNKERLILAVMVGILGWRVMRVLESVPEEPVTVQPPMRTITESLEANLVRQDVLPPMPPPPGPAPYPYGTYQTLKDQNPFYYGATAGPQEEATEQWNLQVLDVQEPVPGKRRARIRHGTATTWYDEGDSFLAYELQEVNIEERTATIYSTEFRRSRVFTSER